MLGALFRTMGPFTPPPPPGAQPPPLWGSEDHVRELFDDRVEFRTVKRDELKITASSVPAAMASTLRRATARPSPPRRTRDAPGAKRSSRRR
jgi:hypothetical protein